MLAKKLDINKVTLSKPTSLDNGGKMIFLNYGGDRSPLYLQTPELELAFDSNYFAEERQDKDGNTVKGGKLQVQLSLSNMENNESVKVFHDKLCELDEFLKQSALENSLAWFKKKTMSMDTIESLYTPQVKVSMDSETDEPNGRYPPRLGFKVVKKNDKFECSLYDNDKNVFDVNGETENPVNIENVLSRGSSVKAVLKCNGVWLANGKFGCTWRAEQVRVKPGEGTIDEFAILSDSDEEEGDSNVPSQTLIEDSDDESDDALTRQKSVAAPKKSPPKKKKIRVKSVN